MLENLLEVIVTGRVHTVQTAARQLDIPLALAEQMLDLLVRRGYLVENESCQSGCRACALKASCSNVKQPRLITVTAQGRATLRANLNRNN